MEYYGRDRIMPKIYSSSTLEKIPYWIFLYQNGLSAPKIAHMEPGFPSKTTVNEILRDFGISRNVSRMYGRNNPQWKGDKVNYGALHDWVKSRLPRKKLCQICKLNPPRDLANISPIYNPKTYTRDLSNWRWLCRRCHMIEDGRLDALKSLRLKRPPLHIVCTFQGCKLPHTAKGLCDTHYRQLKKHKKLKSITKRQEWNTFEELE